MFFAEHKVNTLLRKATWVCGRNTGWKIEAWLALDSPHLPGKAQDQIFPNMTVLESLENLLKNSEGQALRLSASKHKALLSLSHSQLQVSLASNFSQKHSLLSSPHQGVKAPG